MVGWGWGSVVGNGGERRAGRGITKEETEHASFMIVPSLLDFIPLETEIFNEKSN